MGSGGWNSSTWGADENWRDGEGEGTEGEDGEGGNSGVALGVSLVGVRNEDVVLPINV